MRTRNRRLGILATLLSVILGLGISETAIRIASSDWREGELFNSKPLVPRNWNTVAQFYRDFLDRTPLNSSFMVYDDVMGWTVGPNRQSKDGKDWSSFEGIRASAWRVSFANMSMREKTVIAVVGDSFAFGQEVAFEESWANLLEKALGSEYVVLNFGVPGYGLDQAYLRYEKDVRNCKPNIVILGIISHDLVRSMVVYPFIDLPL